MISVNFNLPVRAVLTERGAKMYNDYFMERTVPPLLWRTKVAGDEIRTQLWQLCKFFGPSFANDRQEPCMLDNEFEFNEFDDMVTSPYIEPKYFFCNFLHNTEGCKFTADDKQDAQRRVDTYVRQQNRGSAKSDRVHIRGLREIPFGEYQALQVPTYLVK